MLYVVVSVSNIIITTMPLQSSSTLSILCVILLWALRSRPTDGEQNRMCVIYTSVNISEPIIMHDGYMYYTWYFVVSSTL